MRLEAAALTADSASLPFMKELMKSAEQLDDEAESLRHRISCKRTPAKCGQPVSPLRSSTREEDRWVVFASCAWSQCWLSRSAEDVAEKLSAEFCSLLDPVERTSNVVSFSHAYLWDEALPLQSCEIAPRGCLFDPFWRLGAAGDYMTDGTLDGAMKSGELLALDFLALVQEWTSVDRWTGFASDLANGTNVLEEKIKAEV